MAACLCALFVSAFAHGQDQSSVDRMVIAAAARDLTHADATVRGEAALIVAAQHAPEHTARLLGLAQDTEPASRQRALVAIGLAGAPGAVQLLAPLVADVNRRADAEGVIAAYALGLVPDDSAETTINSLLASMSQSSWRRQRDVLVALLLALRSNPTHAQATALRQVWDDESLRDADVRGLLLQVLLPLDNLLTRGRDNAPEATGWRRLLDRGSEPERAALLGYIAANPTPIDVGLVETLTRIAAHAGGTDQRTAALAALTRMRHLSTLDLAATALDDRDPAVVAQAMRSALAIGGAGMRTVLEAHMLHAEDSSLAAMLPAYDAPPSPDLADFCARLAADPQRRPALRIAAARTLARSSPERAAPMLRDLFRSAKDKTALPGLAAALCAPGVEPPPLDRLLDGSPDLAKNPERWQALLTARHPGAVRYLLQVLDDRGAKAERVVQALTLWRRATVLATPNLAPGLVPEALRELLGE